MTINLEKELIKSNVKLMTPEELLVVSEFEQHAGLLNDDSLQRVGLSANLTGGHKIKNRIDSLKKQTERFKQDRVFHISQIQEVCEKYYLRFLPSIMYTGTLDSQLAFKINSFEAAYSVKCQCDFVPDARTRLSIAFARLGSTSPFKEIEPIQNTFIVAPASSFKLQERPKDPLFFYKINDEYYYLIHKWGNDLNLSRRLLSFFSSARNTYLSNLFPICCVMTFAIIKTFQNPMWGFLIGTCAVAFIIITTTHLIEGPSWVKKNNWDSPLKD